MPLMFLQNIGIYISKSQTFMQQASTIAKDWPYIPYAGMSHDLRGHNS